MCYSSQIEAEPRKYVNAFGADISIDEYVKLFWTRRVNAQIKIPWAMEWEFLDPQNDAERQIKAAIDAFYEAEKTRLEQALFKQGKRLADAERTLATRTTKAATESKRIALGTIARDMARLADLHRTERKDQDSRICSGYYAPLLVKEQGRLVVKPMRYQCRPAGKPASFDARFPGTYSARRDNLERFRKELFGYNHGVLAMTVFYENVDRHRAEGRPLQAGEEPENVIVEFKPNPLHTMYAACLWSHWTGNGELDLYSFAATTDEPPAEIAAAGLDRCIIPIKPEHIAAWLDPDPRNLAAQYAILDDRARPYYEYRLAA